jgi:RNA polymerase sigma-70 factor (ECF subfamily)
MLSKEACEQLYRTHAPSAFRRALRLLGNIADADDVVHDVFLTLFERFEQFRGDSSVSTYLYGVMTNACLNRIRNQRRRRSLEEMGHWVAPAHDTGNAAESNVAANQILASLPDRLAEVAVYHYLDELTQREIAAILGCSHTHVGALVGRLGHFLRKETAACR